MNRVRRHTSFLWRIQSERRSAIFIEIFHFRDVNVQFLFFLMQQSQIACLLFRKLQWKQRFSALSGCAITFLDVALLLRIFWNVPWFFFSIFFPMIIITGILNQVWNLTLMEFLVFWDIEKVLWIKYWLLTLFPIVETTEVNSCWFQTDWQFMMGSRKTFPSENSTTEYSPLGKFPPRKFPPLKIHLSENSPLGKFRIFHVNLSSIEKNNSSLKRCVKKIVLTRNFAPPRTPHRGCARRPPMFYPYM